VKASINDVVGLAASPDAGNDAREGEMATPLAKLRSDLTHAHVVRTTREYDRLGPDALFAKQGFSQTKTCDLIWEGRRYPPKAMVSPLPCLHLTGALAPGSVRST
jgi:hypothetical protein